MINQIHFSRVIILFFFFTLLSSCLKDKTAEFIEYNCDESISYSSEIVPMIIDKSCNISGCHNSGTNAGGYSFSNHANVALNSDIIFKVLTHNNEVTPMPLGSVMLADDLIQKFYCWIEQGELDN